MTTTNPGYIVQPGEATLDGGRTPAILTTAAGCVVEPGTLTVDGSTYCMLPLADAAALLELAVVAGERTDDEHRALLALALWLDVEDDPAIEAYPRVAHVDATRE